MTAAQLSDARLYLCTDARGATADLERFCDAVLSGGVDIIQLRHKGLEARDELAALRVMRASCQRHGALLAVNDRADIAVAAGADVLHLGQDDLPVSIARQMVGSDMLIGRSTHAADESEAALVEDGVDYIAVGPCWPTPTKPGRPAPGLDLVRHVASLEPAPRLAPVPAPEPFRPWFAIGGIDANNLAEVLAAGARRVVVVRALTQASDPHAAALALSTHLRFSS